MLLDIRARLPSTRQAKKGVELEEAYKRGSAGKSEFS